MLKESVAYPQSIKWAMGIQKSLISQANNMIIAIGSVIIVSAIENLVSSSFEM